MKKIVLILAALTALAVAAPAAAANLTVAITRTGFVPNNLTIVQGDSITWTNSDTQNHQVASQQGPFTSPVLQPTQTFSYTFTKAGKFTVTDPLTKKEKMNVTVNAAPGSAISIAVSRALVTYGGAVNVSGSLADQKSGETVTVESKPCGSSSYTRVATATTTSGGAYAATVKPLKNTSYQSRNRNQTSSQLTVRVRPGISLGKIAPRRYTVRVRASDSFAGKAVSVQRFNAATGRWVLVRYTTLRANSTGIAPTVVSSVTFTAKLKARTRVRVVMGSATAGSCYAPSISNVVLA
ncbi:MAG TPA: cupredoxin domain-containing protein [Gaiellaceae bacterium]|jgi:plastocyanin